MYRLNANDSTKQAAVCMRCGCTRMIARELENAGSTWKFFYPSTNFLQLLNFWH